MKVDIWILVGHSGSGKTTVAEKICSMFNMPRLHYGSLLDDLAHQKGYPDRGAFYDGVSFRELRQLYDTYVVERVSDMVGINSPFLIDGLCSLNAFNRLYSNLSDYNIKVIYIEVPESVRIERIKVRDGGVWNDKELTKAAFGLDELVKLADYTIDGMESSDVVLANAIKIISMDDTGGVS